jgi:hypothetical protein
MLLLALVAGLAEPILLQPLLQNVQPSPSHEWTLLNAVWDKGPEILDTEDQDSFLNFEFLDTVEYAKSHHTVEDTRSNLKNTPKQRHAQRRATIHCLSMLLTLFFLFSCLSTCYLLKTYDPGTKPTHERAPV